MDSLVFVAGTAVLLVALHVAIAAYLYRVALGRDGPGSDAAATEDERPVLPTDRRAASTDDTVSCPTCGAPNDPGYRFCRRCVADLSGRQPTNGSFAAGRLGS